MENTIHGDLRLGCSLTIGEYILPEFLKTFKDAHPDVHMQVEIANSANIINNVKDQLIDVGLIETPISDKQILVEQILKDELVLIAAPDYFPKHMTHITAEQLRELPFIMREQGSGTREVVHDYLDKAGLLLDELNIVMEMGSTEAIKATVQSGLGVSFVSRNAVKKEQKLKLLKIYQVKGIPFFRYFYIALPKNRVIKSITEHFIKELHDIIEQKVESNLIHLPAGNA
ncbi:LysR substrate-binding domain-containing protein [Virgibacillus halophilus]|uniref:LysR substrate-binding domain-containing protein n=2 Tax=Tigheibacillus halophilus TaxID=361280 RepID=A0ABU5C4Q2_9BACI|nr:LysR substrate-binding domain-containing protein [Virgibacillus halophilus]